jgi:hypothetical protein
MPKEPVAVIRYPAGRTPVTLVMSVIVLLGIPAMGTSVSFAVLLLDLHGCRLAAKTDRKHSTRTTGPGFFHHDGVT